MNILLIALHVFLSLGIITLVLLQKGSGASAGASFGGGGAGSVFGASGSSNFLSKTTALFAIGFFVNSLVLAYLAANRDIQADSVIDTLLVPETEISVPVDDASTEHGAIPEAAIPAPDEVDAVKTEKTELPPASDTSVTDDIPPPAGQ